MTDLIVVGSANLDLVVTVDRRPAPGETVLGRSYAEHPGGKGLNQAIAAARAGSATAFVGSVGRDPAADRLLEVLAADRVDAAGVRRVASPTGRALIVVDRDAENSIVVVPGANLDCVVDPPLPPARVVLAQLEIPPDTAREAFDQARARGATTILNPSPVDACEDALVALADIVVPNEHEVEQLGGVDRLLAQGVTAVVVTYGAAGVEIRTRGDRVRVPAFQVEAVDTTGAGDAFTGALGARLAAGDDLLTATQWAAAAGALATTVHGAVPSLPSRREVEAFVRQR